MICYDTFWRFRPSTLIDFRWWCILKILLFLAIKLIAFAIGYILLIFKKFLLCSLSILLWTLPAYFSVRLLHEKFSSICQILTFCYYALIKSICWCIHLWLVHKFYACAWYVSIKIFSLSCNWSLFVNKFLLWCIQWFILWANFCFESFIKLIELLVSPSCRYLAGICSLKCLFLIEVLLGTSFTFMRTSIILRNRCFNKLLVSLFSSLSTS